MMSASAMQGSHNKPLQQNHTEQKQKNTDSKIQAK